MLKILDESVSIQILAHKLAPLLCQMEAVSWANKEKNLKQSEILTF